MAKEKDGICYRGQVVKTPPFRWVGPSRAALVDVSANLILITNGGITGSTPVGSTIGVWQNSP